MSLFSCLGSKRYNKSEKAAAIADQTGVMPETGFYGRKFTKILGSDVDSKISEAVKVSKKHTFQPDELVVITVPNEMEEKVRVYGRITGVKDKNTYEIATKDPDSLSFGYVGYLHTISSREIGKIPPTFTEFLISKEKSIK